MIAYLYLPPHVPRPLQVMHLIPAGDVDAGFRSLPAAMDDRMAPFIKAMKYEEEMAIMFPGPFDRCAAPVLAAGGRPVRQQDTKAGR